MKLKYYLRGLGTGIAVTALIIGISGSAAGKKTMTDEEVKARAKELGMVERTVLSEMETATQESQAEENSTESKQAGESMEEESSAEAEEESDLEETPTESTDVQESMEKMTEETEEEAQEEVQEETQEEIQEEIQEESQKANSEVSKEILEEATQVTQTEENETETELEIERAIETELDFGMPDEVGTISIQIVRGDSSDSVSRRLAEAGLVDNAANYDRYLCQNGYDKRIQIGNYEIPANATEEEIARMITSR